MQVCDVITTISSSEKSKVDLVCNKEDEKLYIRKERHKADIDVLKHIMKLDADFVPKVHDFEQSGDTLLILEEYIPGKTLRELIDEGNIEERLFINVVVKTVSSLKFLHNESPQIIYRDLKPENILMSEDNRIIFLDFDAAREHKPDAASDTVLLGTREYAAPEQFGFSQTDVRSDIYSLGIVIQELAASSKLSSNTSKLIQKIIRKSTMFDPNDRYSNIEMVEKDLNNMFSTKKNVITCILVFIIAFAIGSGLMYLLMSRNTTSTENVPQYATYESILALEPDSAEIKETQMIDDIGNGHYGMYGYPDHIQPKVVYIPTSYNGGDVRQIMNWAFAYRTELKAVIIPETVLFINQNVFLGCTNLEAVVIPKSMQFIEDSAFSQCPSVVIYGYSESYAEEYAYMQRIPFVAIDE